MPGSGSEDDDKSAVGVDFQSEMSTLLREVSPSPPLFRTTSYCDSANTRVLDTHNDTLISPRSTLMITSSVGTNLRALVRFIIQR
jgi:hypothetical protein